MCLLTVEQAGRNNWVVRERRLVLCSWSDRPLAVVEDVAAVVEGRIFS